MFEGQQLEKLYDLLEEYKSALSNNSEYENRSHKEQLVSSYTQYP